MSDVEIKFVGDRFVLSISGADDPHRIVDLSEQQVSALLFQASQALAVKQAVAGKDPLLQEPMVNAFSPSIATGTDGHGNAMIQFQIATMPPMRFRLTDDDARHIITHLQEVLDTPADVRASNRAN